MGSEFLWFFKSSCGNSAEPFSEIEATVLQDWLLSDQDENVAAALILPIYPTS